MAAGRMPNVFSKVMGGLALASGGALGLVHAQQVNASQPVSVFSFPEHRLIQTRSPICMWGVPVTCALVQMHRHMCIGKWQPDCMDIMLIRNGILVYSALG
jgi:hypothetical protein